MIGFMFIPDVALIKERPLDPPAEDLPAVPADWSARPSQHIPEEAHPRAVSTAQTRLRDISDDARLLEATTNREFLQRLGVITRSGLLTNAGALLFVRSPNGGIDYELVGRETLNCQHIHNPHLPLLLQMSEIDEVVDSANPWVLVEDEYSAQVRDLPPCVWEEALVNGLAHRDWTVTGSIHVTHRPQSGTTLEIVSPGAFPSGADPATVVVNPPARRNPHLWAVLARLGYGAGGEGGAKEMAAGMISIGRPPPVVTATGNHVRTVVNGGKTDIYLLAALNSLYPTEREHDADFVLILNRLLQKRWVDYRTAARVCGYPEQQAAAMLQKFVHTKCNWYPDRPNIGWSLLVPITKGLTFERSAYRLNAFKLEQRTALRGMRHMEGTTRITRHRMALIDEWLEHWGSISPREAAIVAWMSENTVRPFLARMAKDRKWVDERSCKGVRYHLGGYTTQPETADLINKD